MKLIELRAIAATVADETRVTVEWTESREGTAHPATRHVTAPSLERNPLTNMALYLHEVGHVVAPRDHPVGQWRRECAASVWAAFVWRTYDIPHYDAAAYVWGKRLGEYLRTALREGKATVEEIRQTVPDTFLRYAGELRAPTHISDMSEAQLRVALKSGVGFPEGMNLNERLALVGQLREWPS
jgi:hypothetical protein